MPASKISSLHSILKIDDRTLYPGDFIHSERLPSGFRPRSKSHPQVKRSKCLKRSLHVRDSGHTKESAEGPYNAHHLGACLGEALFLCRGFSRARELGKVIAGSRHIYAERTSIVFALRGARFALNEPIVSFEGINGGSILYFYRDVAFAQLEPEEVNTALRSKVPVPTRFAACLRATFSNGDSCFLFRED